MIDADTLALMQFEWPIEFFYLGAAAGLICAVLAFGVVLLIERFAK